MISKHSSDSLFTLLYRNQALWNLIGIMSWEISSPDWARDNRGCKAMAVKYCFREKNASRCCCMEQTQRLRGISWPGGTFWLSLTPCQPVAKVPTAFRSSIKMQPWNSKRYFLASAIFLLLQLLVSFSYLTTSTRCGPPHCRDINPTICRPSPLHIHTG